jgi:hypothetical protein
MRLLEVKQPNIIVVYGGGFQPFHEGHASSYREAKAAFPGAYFFIAASNVTTERPFEFKEKQFLAKQAGVVDPFIQVGTMSYVNDNGRKVTSTPLNPLEVLKQFNPEKDVLVIVRSERDPMKTTDVSYYQPWQGLQGAEPFSKHAYIFVTKKHDFTIAGNPVYSGSQVRELYSNADDKTKLSILQDLYPQSRQLDKIKKIFDKRLAVAESAEIDEGWIDSIASKLNGKSDLEKINDRRKKLGYEPLLSTPKKITITPAYKEGFKAGTIGFERKENPYYNYQEVTYDLLGIVKQKEADWDRGWLASKQDLDEASLATMRDYFAGDEKAQDPMKITQQRLWFDKNKTAGHATQKKEFRSKWEYEQWLKQNKLKQISDSEEYNLEEEAANLLEYLRKIHKRWAIVSKREGRPLVYFKGDGKPSKDWVEKQERRINYFKRKK